MTTHAGADAVTLVDFTGTPTANDFVFAGEARGRPNWKEQPVMPTKLRYDGGTIASGTVGGYDRPETLQALTDDSRLTSEAARRNGSRSWPRQSASVQSHTETDQGRSTRIQAP